MTFFLQYSLLALLKLFQWAPLLATLDPFSYVWSIDGDSTVLERHNFLWPNPPANYLPAGFSSSNGSSRISAHDHRSPPSSSTFTYALLISQHKHYLSNFVDSLVLLYSDQLIYFNSGFYSVLVLAALNLGLICLYSVTRIQPKRNFVYWYSSWGSLKTRFHSDSESLSAAPSRELPGTGEFSDGTESACATPDQEAYNSDSGLLATQQDILRTLNKHTLREDLDSPEIMGAASHLYNSRCVPPHEATNDSGHTECTLSRESRSCHDIASLDVSPSLKSSSSADPRQLLRPVHLVRNSPLLAEAVSHEKARTHNSHRPSRKRDGEPHDGNVQTSIPATPNHDRHLSVSSIQASFSSMIPQKRSWSHTATIDPDLEEDSDSSEEGSFDSESPGDQLALGLSISKNENRVTSRLLPSTSRRENILECDSPCYSEPTATPFEMHRRSASTPVPSSRGSQHSSNGLVVTEVERDDSPSSGSERKFDGPDSFWEAAVQERLRVTATFTTLEPLKPKSVGAMPVDLSQSTATDGNQPDRSFSSESAACSPPWSIVTRKARCAHTSPQQHYSGETQDQAPDDDLALKPGTSGLASNQANGFPGLTLRSGTYAKYVPPQRRVAGELVYTVSQRTKPTPRRSERVKFGFLSPMLETRSRSSTLSPWSPFAPHEFPSSTSEAVAWKRGALFLTNPPSDEFAHIDEFGNEKSCCPKTHWKTADLDDCLSGSLTEKHAEGKRAVKDGEEGCRLNAHTSLQRHCHALRKNGHHRCETFGT
ncbi:uncharacterized protein BJ212DRAFT_1348147 [Suillus subaureus]|uniref:Transmembrane protein n=1 Tax=Suillus subaureus TaxID=48587 RepID=A0A9P7ED44_9AGAM|nr:uncharacterized protein BJ212DRAFT_1348147 [Suillus subaureus]KAG1817994.1 hypothetical protein BJ212DRAFT_1348147 [Suillus subaureus]